MAETIETSLKININIYNIYKRQVENKDLLKNNKRMIDTTVKIIKLKDPHYLVLTLIIRLSLEKGTATHFSILAWRTPWTEGPGRLQSKGSFSLT